MTNQNLELEYGLLLKAQDNKDNFGELYKYFINDIYRFNYSILNNKQDAEDITSQTFVEFYKKIDSFVWQGVSLKYWLFKTSRNLAYKKIKKSSLYELNENTYIPFESEISFVDKIIHKDLLDKVQEEIQKLNPIEQEVINLRIWEGLQFSHIAEIQSSTESATKKRFYRAIEKLKNNLERRDIKAFIALPILFTAIAQVGAASAYIAPVALTTAGVGSALLLAQSSGVTTIKSFLLSKLGISLTTAAIVTSTAIGGSVYYLNNKPESKKESPYNEVTVTSSPTPNSVSITPTTTQIPAILYDELSTYKDKLDNYTLTYPSSWNIEVPCSKISVEMNPKCDGPQNWVRLQAVSASNTIYIESHKLSDSTSCHEKLNNSSSYFKNESTTFINGEKARILEGIDSSLGKPIFMQKVMLASIARNSCYTFFSSSDNTEEAKKINTNIIESFKYGEIEEYVSANNTTPLKDLIKKECKENLISIDKLPITFDKKIFKVNDNEAYCSEEYNLISFSFIVPGNESDGGYAHLTLWDKNSKEPPGDWTPSKLDVGKKISSSTSGDLFVFLLRSSSGPSIYPYLKSTKKFKYADGYELNTNFYIQLTSSKDSKYNKILDLYRTCHAEYVCSSDDNLITDKVIEKFYSDPYNKEFLKEYKFDETYSYASGVSYK